MPRKFIELHKIYGEAEIKSKNYTIKSEVWREDSTYGNLTYDEIWKPLTEVGRPYICLVQNDNLHMMTDHPTETVTNQHFIDRAKGDVLIFGMGLGLIIFPLLEDSEITSITVVEMDEHLINDVSSIIKSKDSRGILKIVNGDAFEYHKQIDTEKFDTIYFDIWQNVDDNAYTEMNFLHRSYYKFLKSSDSFMDSWLYFQRLKIVNSQIS